MSIAETPPDAPTKAKKPAKKRKPRKAPRAAAPATPDPKPLAEFAGLSMTECCMACNAGGCVISGNAYCGHPRKGGLQGSEMHDRAAIDRLNNAKKALGFDDLNRRFS